MNHLMQNITAARPGLYSKEQRDEWQNRAAVQQKRALRQEIALAEAKRDRLNEAIAQKKKSLARIEAEEVLTSKLVPCASVSVVTCR